MDDRVTDDDSGLKDGLILDFRLGVEVNDDLGTLDDGFIFVVGVDDDLVLDFILNVGLDDNSGTLDDGLVLGVILEAGDDSKLNDGLLLGV